MLAQTGCIDHARYVLLTVITVMLSIGTSSEIAILMYFIGNRLSPGEVVFECNFDDEEKTCGLKNIVTKGDKRWRTRNVCQPMDILILDCLIKHQTFRV